MPGKFALHVRPALSKGRGTVTAEAVIDAMKDCWNDMATAIDENLSKAQQTEMLEHFNNLIEDHDELGELLFGDYDDFEAGMDMLSAEQKAKFCNELQEAEIITIDE